MFCWCPLPCVECTKLIINSGITRVYCFKESVDYSVGSRFLFKEACVVVTEVDKNFIDTD